MASLLPPFQALPLPIGELSLEAVLKCGQSFRWSVQSIENDTEYRLCLRDRVVCLRQSATTLFYRAVFPDSHSTPTQNALRDAETLVWLKDYFQLDIELAALYTEWSSRDPVFARMQPRFQGIRILRQDPWENLISFICSSNNNITRITKMVQSLCTHYSPPLLSIHGEDKQYYPFPPPSALAQPGVSVTLRSLGFGYRADFINRTAKMLIESCTMPCVSASTVIETPERWLMGLRSRTTADAREELLKFVGVGRKVADCVMLMSLDKKEVIPVDTHVHQIAVKHYGFKGASTSSKKVNMTPKIYDDINTKLRGIWGEYAGWAHSVLFTADLRTFASYNLPTRSSTPPGPIKQLTENAFPTPPITPSLSPLKRTSETFFDESSTMVQPVFELSTTPAERVKRRRCATRPTTVEAARDRRT